MIRSIYSVTFLVLLYSTVTVDKASTIVHHNEFYQGCVPHHLHLVHIRDRHLAMADLAAPGHVVEEKLVSHLLKLISDMLGAERKEFNDIIKTERDHATEKLLIITNNYNSRLGTFEAAINKLLENQAEMVSRIKTLEYEITNTNARLEIARDTLEEALGNCSLKSETKTLYLE